MVFPRICNPRVKWVSLRIFKSIWDNSGQVYKGDNEIRIAKDMKGEQGDAGDQL